VTVTFTLLVYIQLVAFTQRHVRGRALLERLNVPAVRAGIVCSKYQLGARMHALPCQYGCACQWVGRVHCVRQWNIFWKRLGVLLESGQYVRIHVLVLHVLEFSLARIICTISFLLFLLCTINLFVFPQYELRGRAVLERFIVPAVRAGLVCIKYQFSIIVYALSSQYDCVY
jgi:hypothetical protein